jgi:hypothetical protein
MPITYDEDITVDLQNVVNVGNVVNDGLGDDLRTAFRKINLAFATLDNTGSITAENLGIAGTGLFRRKIGNVLQFKSLIEGQGITIDGNSPDSVTISTRAITSIDTDTTAVGPVSGSIAINGVAAQGGSRPDIEVSGNGSFITIRTLVPIYDTLATFDFGTFSGIVNNPIQLSLAFSNIDFGTILEPSTVNLDLGPIVV